MKWLLTVLMLCGVAYGQTIGDFRYDTTKFRKIGGYNEVKIQNKTKDTLGIFTNIGNGWGVWKRAYAVPSGIVIGNDTIPLSGVLQDYWSIFGNGDTDGGLINILGTTNAQKLVIATNNVHRLSVNADGIKDYIGTSAKALVIDTNDVDRGLGFATVYNDWHIDGNAGTDPSNDFIGTTDAQPLIFKVNNVYAGVVGTSPVTSNVALGKNSLPYLSGGSNVAVGFSSLGANVSGFENVSVGESSLEGNTTGNGNTGIGNASLQFVTTGQSNTALGQAAGTTVTTGSSNTFIGAGTNTNSSSASNRTAIGANASVTQNNSLVLGASGTNVGIGKTDPDSTLTVVGGLRFATGRQGAGKVLTSDATGGADWQTSSYTVPTLQQAIDAGKDVSYSMDSTYFWKFTNTGGDKSFVRLDNIDDGTIDLRFYNGGALSDSLTGFIDNTGASAFHYVSANHFIIRKGLGIFDVFPQTTVNANNITANRAAEMPDSNGIIPLRVKLGSTTYSPDVKGTIDLGTVGTVTNVSATDGSGFDFTVTNPTTTPTISLTTSLTTGSVPFIGASGALSQDNSNLFFDNTQKQLGIGTNIPSTFVSQTGITGGLLNVTNSVAYARMYAQGVTGGLFAVADLGAGTDVKQLQFRSDNGLATMEGVNDIGTALTYNFMTFDLSNGNVGVGGTPTEKLDVTGNIKLNTAGNKILIATGSNASIGTSAAMTAGTITISTTAVTANSKIFLTAASVGGTQGILSVGTITAGTSFVINSSSATDTGTVNWWIVN